MNEILYISRFYQNKNVYVILKFHSISVPVFKYFIIKSQLIQQVFISFEISLFVIGQYTKVITKVKRFFKEDYLGKRFLISNQ